ncbi:type VI secretion system protein ImpH [Labrenzia sp. MBR-25]
MTGPADKDRTKTRVARDKTVVPSSARKAPAWPAIEDQATTADDAESSSTDTLRKEEAQGDDLTANTTSSHERKSRATEHAAATTEEVDAVPSFAETQPPDSPDTEVSLPEEVPAGTAIEALQPQGQPPMPDPASEEAVPEAPRIEVPVQQQYASLLSALAERIQTHPGGHDLLAVLRMLEGQTAPGRSEPGVKPKNAEEPAPPRIGKSRRMMEDIVRFGQDPSSEFATSTIERATRDGDGGLVLLERFLGMLGPQGALPSAYTDEAIMRGLTGDDSFPRFLDIFNNRFVQLFYRAWADARPIVQHDRPDDDRFLAYLGSAIGIGTPIYRDLDRIDDRLKLLYAGLMSPKTKSASRLKALITGVFDVKVEIDQCVGTWLHLDRDDQLKLGGFGPGGGGKLGADTIVGSKVYSVSDKIRIRIFTRTLEEYRKFLPPTRVKPNPWTEKLFDLIDFYLGLEVEYEIELALPKRCASAVRMDATNSATLGHIGWLKPAASGAGDDAGAEAEEEDMLTDTRFRPVRRHTTVYQ